MPFKIVRSIAGKQAENVCSTPMPVAGIFCVLSGGPPPADLWVTMAGKGIIRLADALEIMESGVAFDLVHFTCDEKKETGGVRKVRTGVTMTSVGRKGKTGPSGKAKEIPAAPAEPGKVKRNPNHFGNATRNIIKPNGQTRTVHLFLITEFNGLKVII